MTQRVFPIPVMMQANTVNASKKVYFPGKHKITAKIFMEMEINNKM